MDPREDEKRAAAEMAAELVEDGMRVGLGTGTTVAHFLPALARRELRLTCVATSPATDAAARAVGLRVEEFDALDRLDIAVDGADQVAPDHWVMKGGGGAQTRERIVAEASDRFVVIVSADKVVQALRPPVPLELLRFGVRSTLRRVGRLGTVGLREDAPGTPDGNVLADYTGEIGDPGRLAGELEAIAGVVGHGLFPPELVSEVIVGRDADRAEYLPPVAR